MKFDEADRLPRRLARTERVADLIVVVGLAGLLAACANWLL